MTCDPRHARLRVCASLALLLLTFVTPSARANPLPPFGAPTCDLKGLVVDQAGDAVDGARVALLDASNVELRHAVTDAQGRFAFAGLAAANYVAAVSKGGFRETRHVLRLAPGGDVSVTLRLEVGEFRESVTVTPSRGEAQEVFETPEAVAVATAQ